MLDQDGMPQTEEVEVKIPAFRAVSVFDVSQTDGEPIPELEAKELLSTVEGYEDFIKAITYVAPAPIGFEDIPGDSKGYFSPTENRIAVQEGMSESQTLKPIPCCTIRKSIKGIFLPRQRTGTPKRWKRRVSPIRCASTSA